MPNSIEVVALTEMQKKLDNVAWNSKSPDTCIVNFFASNVKSMRTDFRCMLLLCCVQLLKFKEN